ncbi:SPRY domain-containing SOCS box protein 3 isoform X2 [Latimeria chalumnae]|uniref:SPRY domain-containing SOCS box protein 3 isoform X2 n=1 Tax=Latimeria chalumnae TaxID=7897 RepID=UPI0003C19FBC|nr:PREDICTED: SPRY domain-containing SOCS box protein 3-like isoform X2 [Latimeria chalumnae]|eukprot:XP_005986996.1 PREDICTED: SPRY domain-containing SOCS box protein 3-like isoform X2 [Latimeria chalumnae]
MRRRNASGRMMKPSLRSNGYVEEFWEWDTNAKSPAAYLSPCRQAVYFHIDPVVASEGTAGVRGTKGMDCESWGLSYKGTVWHHGQSRNYTEPFYEKKTVIGVSLNLSKGTLAFSRNGQSLGVAFTGLKKAGTPLYPIVCSTAAETELQLGMRGCRFPSLEERCCSAILQTMEDKQHIDTLPLPGAVRGRLKDLS